ncbi:Uncharacterised protein [Chromobacterium vaccinii]|nr:Uncharacterised protein [Chromobacterium vaccinii]
MPNTMPMVSAIAKPCSAGPPNTSIDTTIISVEKWVMMVRLMVEVMALSITSATAWPRMPGLRKFSRIRSNTTTDSFTE